MLITWEEKDIICGRKIKTKNASEILIIGYSNYTQRTYYIFYLLEGLVGLPSTKEELINRLNNYHYIPV